MIGWMDEWVDGWMDRLVTLMHRAYLSFCVIPFGLLPLAHLGIFKSKSQ